MNKNLNNKKFINKTLVVLPLISNYSSRQEWEAACWQKILKSEELLELLVTANERHNLVNRAVALNEIISGKSYQQISEELWLSPQTISGIKKSVSGKKYQSYFERSKKERKKKQYSFNQSAVKSKSAGRPWRTKYGTIYMPQ